MKDCKRHYEYIAQYVDDNFDIFKGAIRANQVFATPFPIARVGVPEYYLGGDFTSYKVELGLGTSHANKNSLVLLLPIICSDTVPYTVVSSFKFIL